MVLVKTTLKKFCANCVMVAGAVTALTGAVKSVVELIPPGCKPKPPLMGMMSKEDIDDVMLRPSAPMPAPATEGSELGRRTFESQPERKPTIMFSRREEPEKKWWAILVWPVVLGSGLIVLAVGGKMKRNALVEKVAKV